MAYLKRTVAPSSRYFYKQIIYYGDSNKTAYKIYVKSKLTFAPEDKYYELTASDEYRPDLVSFRFYGVPDYWWRIMEMNGMKDILEFRSGRNIRLPGGRIM